MRVDKLLWFLRLAKTRNAAQAMVMTGHARLNSRRLEKCSQAVVAGDVLTLPHPAGVRIIEILSLPGRRGPASEALACYRTLDGQGGNPIADDRTDVSKGISLP